MKKISIIVPCYNEQECISDSIAEIKLFIKKTPKYRFNVIFINDGSIDDTYKIITKYI